MITWTETVIMSMSTMTEITIVTDMKNTPIPAIEREPRMVLTITYI